MKYFKMAEKKTEPVSYKYDKRITILQVIGTATRGGMENQILNLLKHLPSNQFRVVCICPCESKFTESLRALPVDAVYTTPLSDDPEWRSIQLAMEVARLHRVDIFHAHMPKSHVLAGIAGSLLHVPVVATIHGMHITPHELGVALAVKSHLIANCQETYIQALAMGVPAERVNLFHNGVDVKSFTAGSRHNKLRQYINVSPGTTVVGFVGRLEYEKGPDHFVRSAALVHDVLPDVHFIVAGAGSMLKELQKMVEKMHLKNVLHFIDWSTNTEEVYRSLDILVHTSRSDGTSLVVLEAMACAVPVAAMAVGGIREIVENEYTGMLVPSNDWQKLASEIIALISRPSVLHSMGIAARERIELHFDAQINAKKTAGLLKTIVSSWKHNKNETDNQSLSPLLNGNGRINSSA
jgi:glycosyltransferase involved in cell wall biosynthesis